MKILYHKVFVKHFKKRILPDVKLKARFEIQLRKLLKNSKDPSLKDHVLVGKMSTYRAFSVTGDIRVVYKIIDGGIQLYDIGSHNQVY